MRHPRLRPLSTVRQQAAIITMITFSLGFFTTAAWGQDTSAPGYQESDVMPTLSVTGSEEETSVRAGGMLQFWALPMVGEEALIDNGDVANAPGFRLRRARIGLAGTFPKYVSMELTIDPLDAHHMVHDAHLVYQPLDELGLVFGSAKVPYSRYQLDSSSKLRFYDRPFGTGEVAINHRLGVAVQGSIEDGMLSYVAGVYNASDSMAEGNSVRGLLYGGRLETAPLGGLAALTPDAFRMRLGGGAIFENGATQDTFAYSGDITLEGYRVQLRGEYLHDKRTPDEAPTLPHTLNAEVERQSIVGELSGFILTDRLEVAFRYETFDSNTGVEDFGDTELYVGGINGYIYGHRLKAMLNYIHRNEPHSVQMDNDALVLAIGGSI